MTDVPHLTLPFRFAPGGHALENEQDSLEDVASCCEAILRCPLGYRPEIPDFGCADQTFALTIDRVYLADVITRYEPRASPQIETGRDPLDDALARVRIQLRLPQD